MAGSLNFKLKSSQYTLHPRIYTTIMSSASVVELELASHIPLPVSVSDLSQYAQPVFEARLDNELDLQEFSENRTEHRARLRGESDQSISSTNVSSLPPVDKGRKAWQFVRTIPGFVSLYAGVSDMAYQSC